MKRKYLWAVVYSIALTAFTVYAVLDTFVIEKAYVKVPVENKSTVSDTAYKQNLWEKSGSSSSENPDDKSSESTENAEKVSTENEYRDENIHITLTKYRENNTDIYAADVQLSSPEYLKTALAKGYYGRNITEKTSEMAEQANAILAVNGDYYGARENGYVIRNGNLLREEGADDTEALVINNDGSFEIVNQSEASAQDLLDKGARQVLSFGPGLVKNGEISVSENEEVGKAMASNPRTAIGFINNLHYVFVVSDGRTNESEGLSLYELGEFMQSLNVKTAYNLDGGGSSTMVFQGKIINNPTTNGRSNQERSVSDIVYIGKE